MIVAHQKRQWWATAGGGLSPWRRDLRGRLRKRVVNIHDPHRPDAVVNCWADDTGIRRVLGCSDFCLATDWQYNRALAQHDISYAAQFYHYIRAFRRLGESATGGYFGPRSVLMPWCINALCEAIEFGAQYDMRWQLSHGYQYTSEQERLDFEGGLATELQRRGLAKFLFAWEIDNEYWQNGWLRGDLDRQRQEGLLVEKLLRSILDPCPYVMMGAPENEGPDLILKSLLTDWVSEIHTARDRDWMVKHVFATWYMEGHPGQLVVANVDAHNQPTGSYTIYPGPPYIYGEPTPMAGGPDDFMGTPDPGAQFAMNAMGTQCGGAVTYFDGWDVRSAEPIEADAPTFESWPKFIANIPEDACTWPPVHGGSIWHWGKPNTNEFVTVMDAQWYGGYFPPKPVAEWTAYGVQRDEQSNFHDGGTVIGPKKGKITLPPDFGGALIYGTFAA